MIRENELAVRRCPGVERTATNFATRDWGENFVLWSVVCCLWGIVLFLALTQAL